jgi:hypothetical protein
MGSTGYISKHKGDIETTSTEERAPL